MIWWLWGVGIGVLGVMGWIAAFELRHRAWVKKMWRDEMERDQAIAKANRDMQMKVHQAALLPNPDAGPAQTYQPAKRSE